ncbi:MAG: single-stranded DNA-binding protein [Candidatus Caenarcaniphilales bacterium]|nr:single-stranded DNA-binding protein [Candidatus Caenarcaniphilales bacterium]
MGFCRATLSGKITADPVTRYTSENVAVTRLELITGQGASLSVACWGNLAEVAKTLRAGDLVLTSGTLQTSSYKTTTGQNRKDIELKANDLYLLPGEPRNLNPITRNSGTGNNTSNANSISRDEREEDLADVFSDDDVPF